MIKQIDLSPTRESEFVGIVLQCDRPTRTGWTFPRDGVEQAIVEFNKLPTRLGELDIPSPSRLTIDFDRVSHEIVDTFVNDWGIWVARYKVLETPMGNVLQDIINHSSFVPRLSARMCGFVSRDGVVSIVRLAAIDVLPDEDTLQEKQEETEKQECSLIQELPFEKDGLLE